MRAPVHDLHVSNLLTYAALAAAVTACLLALDPRTRPLAAAAVAAAAIADTFDGKFARLFRRTSRQARCGMEIDSLVDAIAFGAAPLVVLFADASHAPAAVLMMQWMAAVAYAIAVTTRLAFYNVESDSTSFVGAPAPAAALVCVTALLLPNAAWMTVATVMLAAVLMVAPIRLPRPRAFGLMVFVTWAVAVCLGHLGRYQ